MVLGIGIDLVETARIARALASHGDRFALRVFSPAEVAYCARRANRAECLAARWAAKEAFLKAIGTGWSQGLVFRDVEVAGGDGRPPRLLPAGRAAARLAEMGVRAVRLSLTHEGAYAAAVVLLEG